MITIKHRGSFKNISSFLKRMQKREQFEGLDALGAEGVLALEDATPKNTGETARSWYYTLEQDANGVRIYWHNDEFIAGAPLVILLQYGHGTGRGGYVQGRDFINPAMQPIFDRIADQVWKAVTSA